MQKEKTLILMEVLNPENDIFFNDWKENGYNASVIFKKVFKPIRAIRRYCLMHNIGDITIWLGNWFYCLNKYECVIIHMNRLTRFLPEIIINKYPNIKVICWYWNTIDKQSTPIKTNKTNIEYFSFDKNDCIKHGLKYNIQYYCPINLIEVNKEFDVYFVGRSKGRKAQIDSFELIAKDKGLKCNFIVIDDNTIDIKPYSEVKKDLCKTRAVLEINKTNQVGFTLRTLESLFYEIKLITDNKEIKNSPIYNKSNIFIIGEDNYDDLPYFINSEYDKSVNKFKEDYCLDTWFNNFFVN